jgi:predicted nucleotidyltransferase
MPPTAANLSKEQLKRYRPFAGRKRAGSMHEAMKVASLIARDLGQKFGAKKVILFGSLSRGDMGATFDIDLAAKGMPPERFFKAVAFATGRSSKWKIDLIDIDDCGAALSAAIEREGVMLWPEEAPSSHPES